MTEGTRPTLEPGTNRLGHVSGTTANVLVVGGGIVGVNVALMACLHGARVTPIDRHHTLRDASHLNLGAVRLSGRAPGAELEMARYGRNRREAIGRRVPGIGFRPARSVTLLRTDGDVASAEKSVEAHSGLLDLELVAGTDIARFEPAIGGRFLAAMIFSMTRGFDPAPPFLPSSTTCTRPKPPTSGSEPNWSTSATRPMR